ncbi:MAG: acyl-CoA dehydratase activase [Candidatus Eremiobacterota bacterium]
MTGPHYTAGIDLGSTYAKAVIYSPRSGVAGSALVKTGFRLVEASEQAFRLALEHARIAPDQVAYVVSTGYGRHQVPFRDTQVTDLTAHARGARFFFPGTRTVLDVGGQTMKASRLDHNGKVMSFRLNDKCAAGTGAFLEKTARYMGFAIEEVGPLAATSRESVPISGVCAVFAESEVINQLSLGSAPSDIMNGAIESLVDRSLQLMKRVKMEPEYTLTGGILRFESMGRIVAEKLKALVNIPPENLVQFTGAIGAAWLGWRRLERLEGEGRLEDHLNGRQLTPTSVGSSSCDLG